ncbi:hypothetical protein [Xenorhabdus bovienii]|uniref:hypothetical protein n=1 Tax=Xenorhabdus bovienii TaxID=40576 RepID=UPI003DA4B776
MIANNSSAEIYKGLHDRIYADFDNERVIDLDIVGLTQLDEVKDFSGNVVLLKKGDYIYLYMPVDESLPEYVFSEGYVIPNPYEFKPYKWCCKLMTGIEFIEEYNNKFI